MSQLVKIENQGLVVTEQQFDLLRQLTFGATRHRIQRIVERNDSFFQTLLSIHFPFESAWIDGILPKITLGSTQYSQFNASAGRVNYAKLGLTFNKAVSFPDLLHRSGLLNQNGIDADSSQLPLDLVLEREYKMQANREFAFRNQLDRETTNRYFDFEEEMLKMKSGRNGGYSLAQLETIEFKYLMLYDSRIYLNFKPYMTKDFVMYFFKNLT